jgi:hypothetical protein
MWSWSSTTLPPSSLAACVAQECFKACGCAARQDAVALHQSADLMAAKWRALARAEQRAACHVTDAQPSLQGGQLEIE